MYPQSLKNQVQELRTKGHTYSEIKRLLNIQLPKSTLSAWSQSVALPKWYKEKIDQINQQNASKGLRSAHAQLKQQREIFLKKVKNEATNVLTNFDLDSLKIALAMLYLGEGAKWKSHSGLMLGNSDPHVICLYIALLEKCYGIRPEQLKCRVSYRCDQNIIELEKFWSKVTGVPLSNFYKTKPDPRTKGKKTEKLDYMGVCVVTCAGTHIQLELETLTKLLLQKITGR